MEEAANNFSIYSYIMMFNFPFRLAKEDSEARHRKSYEEMLTSSSGFQNPYNVSHLAQSMGIFSNRNSLMVGLRLVKYCSRLACALHVFAGNILNCWFTEMNFLRRRVRVIFVVFRTENGLMEMLLMELSFSNWENSQKLFSA